MPTTSELECSTATKTLAVPSRMVIVCVMSVPHISLTLPVMIVPSCGLASVRPTRCRLTHRLQGLEAIGRPRCMNADDFRIGVFHGDEDIGRAFPDGDRLRHVGSPHFIDLA